MNTQCILCLKNMNKTYYNVHKYIKKCNCKYEIHNICFLNHIYYNFSHNKYNIECYFCKKNMIMFECIKKNINQLKKEKKKIIYVLNIVKYVLLFIFNSVFILNFIKLLNLIINSCI